MPTYQVELHEVVRVTRTYEAEAESPAAVAKLTWRELENCVDEQIQETIDYSAVHRVVDENGNIVWGR